LLHGVSPTKPPTTTEERRRKEEARKSTSPKWLTTTHNHPINKPDLTLMGFNKLFAYVGDNAAAIDPTEYETSLREKDPRLLQHDEHIILAFKGRGGKGRDHEIFTNKRVLRRNKKGTTGKRVRYTSIPYKSIRAFSVESAGTVDSDSELKIYARGIGEVAIDFVCDVDILAIHRFLSVAVIKGEAAGMESGGAVVHDSSVNMSGSTGIFDMMGDNYSQVDVAELESKLRGTVLMQDEKVELGFQCGRLDHLAFILVIVQVSHLTMNLLFCL
jgi:hypothetical protein